MKSKTSFFNTTLLRKDILRFAPAWVLFFVYLLLQPVEIDSNFAAWQLSNSISEYSLVNLVYAMVCAQLLFGDLFNTRLCNALHALPVRRESWFVTHILAGVCFSVVPVMAAGLIQLLTLGSYWMAALLWVAAVTLQFVFFFGVAVFSMILVGNRFAAVVVYSILNFLAGIVLWLFYALYLDHLHGVAVNLEDWMVLCPTVWFFNFDWFRPTELGKYVMITDGWGYLLICVAIGLLLLGAALLLYRRRALEKAGDFMAFKPLQPVFLVLYTFSAGAALHLFCNLFMGVGVEYVFLLVGLAVGFFTGLMLLNRTVQVFRLRTFVQFGVILAAFGLSLLLTIVDPLGITRWVPEEGDVKSVTLNYMPYGTEDHSMRDPEAIRQVISIHQHGVDHPEEKANGLKDAQVTLIYELKDGRRVRRSYYIDSGTMAYATIEHMLSRPEHIFGSKYTSVDALLADVVMVEQTNNVTYEEKRVTTDKEDIRTIVEAIMKDCEAGTMCQEYPFAATGGQLYGIYLESKKGTDGWYINYTASDKHTFEAMKQIFP